MIHPRRCNTMESGELKSLLETMPVLSQNNCGALNAPEAEIKSAARRRVRKSRGEQPMLRQNKAASSDVFAIRMNDDYGCERILTAREEIPIPITAPEGAFVSSAYGIAKAMP
jgi:hypothetical protein